MGCSKENDPQPAAEFYRYGYDVESICKSFGIFPKDMDSITAIFLTADSVSYKLAGGMKGNKSWFAKFSPNGTELYSYSLDPNIAQKEYAHIKWPMVTYSNSNDVSATHVCRIDNKLFLGTIFTNENPENSYWTDPKSALSVLDFETGKELTRLPFENDAYIYEINRSNDIYYILSKSSYYYKYLYCLNSNGGLEWHRETTKEEKERGLVPYHDYQALDNKLMLFDDGPNSSNYLNFNIINLETYELKLKLHITFAGDLVGEEKVSYKFHKAEKQNDNIILYFGEYLGKDVIDDVIFGKYHTEYELKNEYYYVVAYPSGEVLGKYKK